MEISNTIEQKHFWYIGRREIIYDVLKRNIPNLFNKGMIEIGCGNGNVMNYLQGKGIDVIGGDIKGNFMYLDARKLPFKNEVAIIGMFDVLEHIEDDWGVLLGIRKALTDKGWLILTVPASPKLWSGFDTNAGHKRRYTKYDLEYKLEEVGFHIVKLSHFMFFLYPVLATIRTTNRGIDTKIVPIVNSVFLWLLRIEKYLMRYFSLPYGSSLIVLAEKR